MVLAVLLSVGASGSLSAGGATKIRMVGTGTMVPNREGDARRVRVSTAGPARKSRPSSFSISGNVSGLFPGAILPLKLTITDAKRFGIIVDTVSTSVGTSSTTCSAKNVTVSTFSGHLHVAARHSAQLSVQVEMHHSAPNACQGTRFTFTYTGRGVRS
jgi:hypothetical protein